MTWLKLDDGFHWSSLIARLSSDAYRLNTGGMCVCCAHATGQVLPKARFTQASVGVRRPKVALRELLEAELWREVEDGWWIRFEGLASLPSDAKREAARRAGEASGEARRAARITNATFNEEGTLRSSHVERSGNESLRARSCAGPRARPRAGGYPIPEPVPDREIEGAAVENPSPVENSLPAGVIARAQLIEGIGEEILIRPMTSRERDAVLRWARLRRGGQFVPIPEIAECARRRMASSTPDGTPATSLLWADAAVTALARQPLDHQVVRPRAASRLAQRTIDTEASAFDDLGLSGGGLQALPGGQA